MLVPLFRDESVLRHNFCARIPSCLRESSASARGGTLSPMTERVFDVTAVTSSTVAKREGVKSYEEPGVLKCMFAANGFGDTCTLVLCILFTTESAEFS